MATSTRPSSSSVGASRSSSDWTQQYGRPLGIVAIVALAAAGGTWLWKSNAAGSAARAEQAFLEAEGQAGAGDPAAAERALRQVANGYRGTAGGAQAAIALARTLYDRGRFADGLAVLERAEAPETLREAVKAMRAAGLEGAGRPSDAAKAYEELARGAARARQGELLASAARAYQIGGDRESARRLWTELAGREGDANADEARVRLGELTASR